MNQVQNDRFVKQLGLPGRFLEDCRVVVELSRGHEHRPEALACFALAANMLSRLFSRVELVAPDVHLGRHPWRVDRVRDLVEELDGLSDGYVNWSDQHPSDKPDVVLSVGAPSCIDAGSSSFVSFSGWAAALDEVIETQNEGVIGALFAACYGASQVFLHAARQAGGQLQVIRPFRLSLLDYSHSSHSLPLPAEISIFPADVVGVGAIGSAMVYALCHIPSLRGSPSLIDNDDFGDSNLHRYILVRHRDRNQPKPVIAANMLSSTGLLARPHCKSYKAFVTEHGYKSDLLLTPVDSEAGRRSLAKCLPRQALNAATGQSTVTVSRHGFADGLACLHCLYLESTTAISTEKRLAMDLGLSEEEVVEMLAENRPVDVQAVRRAERHRGVSEGSFELWIGQHIQSFYQKAVCSEASVPTANGTLTAPLSFISAAAGILLASELIKSSVPALQPHILRNYFRFNLLHAPTATFHECRGQNPTHRCICWDEDFRQAYRDKYGS